MKNPRSLAFLAAALIVTLAPCRADKDVAVSQLPRRVLGAVEARYPSGHIVKAEWDHEGYYEIKVQDGQTHHLLHVRPKGRVLKDEPDGSTAGTLFLTGVRPTDFSGLEAHEWTRISNRTRKGGIGHQVQLGDVQDDYSRRRLSIASKAARYSLNLSRQVTCGVLTGQLCRIGS